jgi:hypothetical protein
MPLDRYKVLLECGSGGRPTCIGEGDSGELEDKLETLRGDLGRVKRLLGAGLDKKDSPSRVASALKELLRIGCGFLFALAKPKFVPYLWYCIDQQRKAPYLLRVELRTPEKWAIPLEILPLHRPPMASSPSDSCEVMEYARAFAAFSAVTRHIITDFPPPTDKHIPADPRIPLLYLYHCRAPSADDAFETMKALGNEAMCRVVSHGPFPSSDHYNSTDRLARLLVRPGSSPAYDQDDTPYRIVHIHAHAETGERSGPRSHKLIFAYPGRLWKQPEEVVVCNGDLDEALYWAIGPSIQSTGSGPLLFLNACGGAGLAYSGRLGLDGQFLEYGYRAVVGPVVSVGGDVAVDIARRFYDYLLGRECDLAAALFHARRGLLRDWLNPFGALYTIHGESGLYVD